MKLVPIHAAAAALLLTACQKAPEPALNAAAVPENLAAKPQPSAPPVASSADPVQPAAPGTPGGLPDDRTPVSEAPFTATSAQGAADVVQTWFALLEAGKRREARALWSGDPGSDDLADPRRYREVHGQVGAPGRIEGAAGSLYVAVPIQAYGRRADGTAFRRAGEARLRRVNGVAGSVTEQRRWHIDTLVLTQSGT
jgi:hypothetical protein